ncbi:MAG: hypothetical protein PHO67_08065 [Candidatus Omnitrophica bacterium]|nr:hypothetical protein [Candidatus Omnitrophota bacterium]
MTKVNVLPGPSNPSKEENLKFIESGASQNKRSQKSSLKKEPEITPERILVWRCLCNAESDRFGKDYIAHIREAKEKGEKDKHKWRLVDAETGEVLADNMRQANLLGLSATKVAHPPQLAWGSGQKNKDEDKEEKPDWKPRSPLVAKWVAATDELPAELLLLYKLFCDRCVAMGMEPPSRGEWITQTITQFYLEHAKDFDLRGMAGEFCVKVCGGSENGQR